MDATNSNKLVLHSSQEIMEHPSAVVPVLACEIMLLRNSIITDVEQLEASYHQAREAEAIGRICIREDLPTAPTPEHIEWLEFVGDKLLDRMFELKSANAPQSRFRKILSYLFKLPR